MDKKIYKITFYKLEVTPKDWDNFLRTLYSATISFELVIVRYGRQVDFYIVSDKKLDVLNSRTYPFNFSEDMKESELKLFNQEAGSRKFWPLYIQYNLLRTLERQTLKRREIYKIHLRFNKFNPFRYFPIIHVSYMKDGVRIARRSFCPRHVNVFLAFDLSKSINAEVSKVKAQLISSDLKLTLHETGILDVKKPDQSGIWKVLGEIL